ncbi:MAG TPA: hypothetical protein VHS59_13130 [Bacillota bacterium]|nr:hypothetical protein [Bacillota bacterium]
MKKVFAYGLASLALVGVLALGGCGSGEKEKPAASTAPQATQVNTSVPGGGFVGTSKCKTCQVGAYDDLKQTWHTKMTNPGVPAEDWTYFQTLGAAAFDKAVGSPLYADLEVTMNELAKVTTKSDGTKDWTAVNPANIKVWSEGNTTVEISQRQGDKLFLKAEFYSEIKKIESLYGPEEFKDTNGWEEYTCFTSCHLTGFKGKEDSAELIGWLNKVTKGEEPGYELGIQCESCHGQGANHVSKPSKANIVNPAKFTPTEQVVGKADSAGKTDGYLNKASEAKACGACHKGKKHQGEYYSKQTISETNGTKTETGPSTHFTSGKVSCLSCHTAHKVNKAGNQTKADNPGDTCKQCHGKSLDIKTYMPIYAPNENHYRHDFKVALPK